MRGPSWPLDFQRSGANVDDSRASTLYRQFPANCCGGVSDASLWVLRDAGKASVREQLCTVLNTHTLTLAQELIMRALINVLEAPPTADVVNEYAAKVRAPTLNVVDPI